jgi:DNA-binding beta-propeller fold protein YncE/predicted small lipoprotein YifL
MIHLKSILLLLIITITLASCGDDLPIDYPNENKIGLICTANLNDINEDELAQVGETITYTYTFKNLGDEKIINLKLNDERLGLVDYVVNINQLLPTLEASITFEYEITQNDLFENSINNQTTISGTLPDGTITSDKSDPLNYETDGLTEVLFTPYLGDYQNGYFVTNEGPFGSGTGTITFIGNNEEVSQNIYQTVNNEDLGNIVQSMTIYNNNAYIVVNNSHKIIVANRFTMEKIAIIEGDNINNPRNFVAVGNTGYISNWGNTSTTTDDFITIVNLETNEITGTIPVGEGPEDMIVIENKIYVNLQGAHHQNNKVEVIDTDSNTISTTITVGDVPTSILKDDNGAIWVLCSGNPNYATAGETSGKLVKIENDEVTLTFNFEGMLHPEHLTLNNNDLIYTFGGKVYTTSITATELNTTIALENLDGVYYVIKARSGKLYTTNGGDFASEGTLKVFDLETNTELNTFLTGISPGSIVF